MNTTKIEKAQQAQFNNFLIQMLLQLIVALRVGLKELIQDETAEAALLLTLQPAERVINAFSDENPNNKEQVLEIVKQHTNTGIIPFAEDQFATQVLERIEDPQIKLLIERASAIPFKAADIWTDNNPKNAIQFKSFLEEYVENPANQKAVIDGALAPMIRSLFKGRLSFMGEFLLGQIKAQLATLDVDFDGDGD